MKSLKLYLLIILLSVFPLIDMFKTSDLPHTSDGAMHVARFAAYYKEFIAGQFPVRWTGQFNYGYGSPIFNFVYPMPYLVGIPLVALGLPLITVLKVSFVLTYFFAGIFMLMFCLAFFKDKKTAILVTIMYQYAPFRLVEMLVRGNIGTLYSYALLPLVFYALVRFLNKKSYSRFTLLSVSVGLLLLTHNIIALVFFGISVLYVFFATIDRKKIITTCVAMAIGLGLAGFFLIPAILESSYTNGYLFTKNLFYQHFPAFYTLLLPNITNDPKLRTAEVSVQIGLFHVLALLVIIFLLLTKKLKNKEKTLAFYVLFVSVFTILFMQPITKPLWENLSLLRQFQFPWRLLSILCFITAIAASFALTHIKILQKKIVYLCLIAAIILSTVYYWSPYQGYQKFSQKFFWNYPGSTNYFAEVNTIWMAHEPVEFPKRRVEIIGGNADLNNIRLSSTLHEFSVNAVNNVALLDRTIFYPGWRVFVDSKSVPIQFQDQNHRGMITFNVPTGNHTVAVQYSENKLQRVSDIVTLFSALLLVIGVFVFPRLKLYEK